MTKSLAVAATALAALAAAPACTPPPVPPGAACAPTGTAPPLDLPTGSPWAGKLCHRGDQRKPPMLNGVVYRDGILWMGSVLGGEIVAADATTGEIVGRFGPPEGVDTGADDLAMTADGTIYWTGMQTGDIGALGPATGTSRKVANAGPWVNPIALAPTGALLVGHAYLASGLVRVDPASGAVTTLDRAIGVNAFALGPDGALYAPRTDTVPGRLVRIDPGTGRSSTVAADIGLQPGSVKFPTPARGEAPTTAYALEGSPAVIHRIDVRTGRRAGADITLPLSMTDNQAFAPDGTLYVTGNLSNQVAVVGVDGRSRVLNIGR